MDLGCRAGIGPEYTIKTFVRLAHRICALENNIARDFPARRPLILPYVRPSIIKSPTSYPHISLLRSSRFGSRPGSRSKYHVPPLTPPTHVPAPTSCALAHYTPTPPHIIYPGILDFSPTPIHKSIHAHRLGSRQPYRHHFISPPIPLSLFHVIPRHLTQHRSLVHILSDRSRLIITPAFVPLAWRRAG